jgi:hypothetical protein
MNPEYKKLVEAESGRIIASLGLSKDRTEWTFEQRFEYNKQLARFVNDNAQLFPDNTRQLAKDISQRDFQPLDEYSLGDAALDFGSEFVSQAEKINPLSEQNRGKTMAVITAAILLGAITYFAVLAYKTDPRRQ